MLLLSLPAAYGQDEPDPPKPAPKPGRITGRISPEANVTIVAKLEGTDSSQPENVKGQVLLERGGPFAIENLPPGTYDLLFTLHGESEKKFIACRWSEVEVREGETTAGINYRLSPAGSEAEVDTVIVGFDPRIGDQAALAMVKALGCTLKDSVLLFDLDDAAYFTLDIPDDKSVEEMIAAFRKLKGVKSADPNCFIDYD